MATQQAVERRVLAEVDRRFDETLAFLRELVRQPSVLGNERGAQEVVFARLTELGLAPEMWDLDLELLRAHPTFGPLDIGYAGRPNVTAVWPAAAPGGRSLILNGHIDVVPPGLIANWSHGPWEALVEGDWLYGRGAADMKAGVAAMILAVEAIRAAGCQLRGDVILESVIEEECTGNGTLACCLRGLRADAALVPEPLSATSATVGVFWFRVRTRGSAGHALAASAQVNAFEKMLPIISALRALEAQMNAEERHPLYQDHPHPINLNLGTIRAGDWPSSVPSECVLECRLACLPGSTVDQAQARVRAAIEAAARSDPWLSEVPPRVEFFGFRAEPSVSNRDSEAIRLLVDCHQSIVGEPLVFRASTACTDERFFINQLGIPSTSYGPSGQRLHGDDERVSIASIRQTAKVLALYTLRWCGIAE